MKEGKISVEEGKSLRRGVGVTKRFSDNDGKKFRACVRLAGLKMERRAGAQVIVSVREEGDN